MTTTPSSRGATCLVVAGTLLFALGLAAPAPAWAGQPGAARKCITLANRDGREIAVNRCNSCRVVRLQRKRPGSGFPITRTYTVPEHSRATLSFRGPGRTRIMGETACGRAAAAETDKEASDGRHCLSFQRTKAGAMVLRNSCRACRTAVIERYKRGGGRKRKIMSVAPGAYVPLAADGAAGARIVTEGACR